jgi:hypothetical protein
MHYLSARKAALAAGKGRVFKRRAFSDFSDWDDPDGYAGHVYSSNTITEVAYDLFFKKEEFNGTCAVLNGAVVVLLVVACSCMSMQQ